MTEEKQYINYTIEELSDVEEYSTCENRYEITDAGCSCCSNRKIVTKEELVDLVVESIERLRATLNELKKK
jgi:hypothetical protein